MDKKRFGRIVSALRHCELTPLEMQFLGRIEEYYEEKGTLTEQQESIIEGIYREKIRWMKKGVQRKEAYAAEGAI